MRNYLGQFPVNIKDTPFAEFTSVDWAMYFNLKYGGIDGSHHKTWVLDQMSRILKGTPVIVELAKWDDGLEEYRFWTGEPSQEYHDWVKDCRGEWIQTDDYEGWEYGYDEGIAP